MKHQLRSVALNPALSDKLIKLKEDALKYEEQLAKKLTAHYIGNKEMTDRFIRAGGYEGDNLNTKIIKAFYWAAISGVPPKAYEEYINAALNHEVDEWVESHEEEVAAFFLNDPGFQDVVDSLVSNTEKQLVYMLADILTVKSGIQTDVFSKSSVAQGKFAAGNKKEGAVFTTIGKNIAKNKLGPGVIIQDTSPHEFQESVLYDINLIFSDFNFPIEVKSGIAKDYLHSSFEYGTFSSTSLGGGVDSNGKHLRDNTYRELLDTVGMSAQELVQEIINGNVVEDSIHRFIINSAIDYIDWRIRKGKYPVFGNTVHSNTASEIITGLLQGKGTIDNLTYKASVGKKYYDIVTGYAKNMSDGGVDFTDRNIRDIQKSALDRAFKNQAITPKFKSKIWYGKR